MCSNKKQKNRVEKGKIVPIFVSNDLSVSEDFSQSLDFWYLKLIRGNLFPSFSILPSLFFPSLILVY